MFNCGATVQSEVEVEKWGGSSKLDAPPIVAIGGSTRSGSSSKRALHIALDTASAAGGEKIGRDQQQQRVY
jgi:hypothetical protein